MNHRYLTGFAAGTLSLMLAGSPGVQAVPLTDIFYGSINPTFDSVGDHYLLLTIGVTDDLGSFVTFGNYVFTDTNPNGISSADVGGAPIFVGNGITQYFTYNPDFSFSSQPANPRLDFTVQSFNGGNQTITGYSQSNFAYTPLVMANYPNALVFSIGDPISGTLNIQQNNPFAIVTDAPELDPSSGTLPLLLMLGGMAAGGRRRRAAEADEE